MPELSIIVPFVGEYPQVVFTAQSIINELRGNRIDGEVIFIDNWCEEVEKQNRKQDKGSDYMKSIAKINPEMRTIAYNKKLSHWQAKNAGVAASSGEFLWFCDSHCIITPGTVTRLLSDYKKRYKELNGTLHLPLSYMLDAPGRELIYKLTGDIEKGEIHYSFTRYRHAEEPYVVPCMSTCGMMMSREIYDELGGWPEELGIYGGGENFINFTMATIRRTVNILPGPSLWHYAEKRGYHWNFDDHLRNRMIATYMFGDFKFFKTFVEHSKGSPAQKQKIMESVITSPTIQDHKEKLKPRQTMDIREWWQMWHK